MPEVRVDVLLLVEDNPSSLGNWFLTALLSYAEGHSLQLFVVKCLPQNGVSPHIPPPEWLSAFLNEDRLITASFRDPNWCKEVEREVCTRLGPHCRVGTFYVCTVFEDYTDVALQLAEHLESPSATVRRPLEDRAWSVRDKSEMRKRWSRIPRSKHESIRNIESYCCCTEGEALSRGRDLLARSTEGIIIKPRGLAASAGVTRVSQMEELDAVVSSVFSLDFVEGLKATGAAPEGIVVEEFVSGREYSLEVIVEHGRAEVVAIVEKHTRPVGAVAFAEIAHVVPARGLTEGDRERLQEAAQLLADALGVWMSVIHLEVLVEAETIFPIEVGIRPAGDRIPLLLYHHCGLNLIDAHIRLALGLPVTQSRLLLGPEGELMSALIFASSYDHLGIMAQFGGQMYSAAGDCVGRWGCVHLKRRPAGEIDTVLAALYQEEQRPKS